MYKKELALNVLQWFVWYKTKTNQIKPEPLKKYYSNTSFSKTPGNIVCLIL